MELRDRVPRRVTAWKMPARLLWCVLSALVCLQVGCTRNASERGAQQDSPQPLAAPGTPADSFPQPDRPVARVVTDTWSNEDARDDAGEAEQVMRLLGVRPGLAVADIGAGSGYYTVRLSQRVGPTGRVLAQDISVPYLQNLRRRVQSQKLANVQLALGDAHDPRLPPGSVDLALLVHMYHEIEQPFGLLYNLQPALRPVARVAVVDLDRPTSAHGTPPALLRCELARAGYRQTAFHRLKEGYLAVFDAPPAASRVAPGQMQACAA